MKAKFTKPKQNAKSVVCQSLEKSPKHPLVFQMVMNSRGGELELEMMISFFNTQVSCPGMANSKKAALLFKAFKYILQIPENSTNQKLIKMLSQTLYSLSYGLFEIKYSTPAIELISPLFSSAFDHVFSLLGPGLGLFYVVKAARYNMEFVHFKHPLMNFPDSLIDDIISLKTKTLPEFIEIVHNVQVLGQKEKVHDDHFFKRSFCAVLKKSLTKIEGNFNSCYEAVEKELKAGLLSPEEVEEVKKIYFTRVELQNSSPETHSSLNFVKITHQTEKYIEMHRISDNLLRQVEHQIKEINELISKVSPSTGVSSIPPHILQKYIQGSEIDIILVDNKISNVHQFLNFIRGLFRRQKSLNGQLIQIDNEEYLRFMIEGTNTCLAMSINNMVAHRTSQLVCMFMSLDERAEKLIMFTRIWGIQNGVINTDRGKLSELHMDMMAISFLQKEKVLPPLQQNPDKPLLVEDTHTWFDTNKEFRSTNDSSLGRLIYSFLKWYAHEFYNGPFNRICDVRHATVIASDLKVLFPILHPFTGEIIQNSLEIGSEESIEVVDQFREKLASIQAVGNSE